MMRFILASALWLATASIAAAGDGTLFSEDFEHGLSNHWKEVKFEGRTNYRVTAEGTNHVLQATAAGTASSFVREVKIKAKDNARLQWRWKIDHCPPGSRPDDLKRFDHAARVSVAFDTWIGQPCTINYVWAGHSPANTSFNHPSSSRARFIVLRSGDSDAGQWQEESRDISADWKNLFGGKMPSIVAIAVMTDTDGTGATVNGYYDDLRLGSQ